MKQTLSFIILLVLIVAGCRSSSKQNKTSAEIYGNNLHSLINKAVNGDTLSNKRLDNLINLSIPVNDKYILFYIDSLSSVKGKKYYFVILNFSNPAYNRFAVYDSFLNCYLIDKSLNGYLSGNILNINKRNYIKVTEDFNSKDVLSVNRISLYSINNDSVRLAFRDFTQLVKNGVVYTQKIAKITPEFIRTQLNSTSNSILQNRQDIFYYDSDSKRYVSPLAIFHKFVKSSINKFSYKIEKPEITDKNSMLTSINSDIFVDTTKSTSNTKYIKGFSLTLNSNWETLLNRPITEYLKKKERGTIFYNKKLNSKIFVFVIPDKDSAEMFIRRKLTRSVPGKYKIRFSEKITAGKFFVQYFEYSCGFKKYLLILKTYGSTYSIYRRIYQSIIDSFKIDC
jgi:hypothetical protein